MDVTLTAEIGRAPGTRSARRLRAAGRVPAVVYGLGEDPVPVSVDWPELRKALTTDAGLNALIDLQVGTEKNLTIIKDIQRDPVRRDVTHVDFIRIDPDADIVVDVPVLLTGESEDLEREGGLVDHILHELTIRAKPGSIPNELEADITDLTLAETVTVGQITLPPGVTTDVDPDDPVAAGYIPRAEVVEEPAEGEEGELAEGEEGEGAEGDAEGEGDADASGDDSGGDGADG